jgi:hypothetical protein
MVTADEWSLPSSTCRAGVSATYLTISWPVLDNEVREGFRAGGLTDLVTYLVCGALGGAMLGRIDRDEESNMQPLIGANEIFAVAVNVLD